MSEQNIANLENRDGFRSQCGFFLSAVGSCGGMDNNWRFTMLVS